MRIIRIHKFKDVMSNQTIVSDKSSVLSSVLAIG